MFDIIKNFLIEGDVLTVSPLGSGHINTTFLVVTTQKKYALQKINDGVFGDVNGLIENIDKVTAHIAKKRPTVQLISTYFGKKYLRVSNGYYRMFSFFDGMCLNRITCEDDMYYAGVGFGQFQADLSDFRDNLVETIPDFHDTPKRMIALKQAVKKDFVGRKNTCLEEIKEYFDRENYCDRIVNLLAKNIIPIRVTHNDTKINNVVLDEITKKPICVIDLDTVMKGSLLYDFGDAIRSGGVVTEEDEPNIGKVKLKMSYFSAFCRGFEESVKDFITDEEVKQLAFSAILMTYECGMRFLTDYLNGDVYFKVDNSEQNLRRARTQLALVVDMEKNYAKMQSAVEEIYGE